MRRAIARLVRRTGNRAGGRRTGSFGRTDGRRLLRLMGRAAAWSLPAVLSLLLSGCGTQADKRVLEELGMVSVMGFDLEKGEASDEKDSNRTTVLFPVINPMAKVEEETLSVASNSNDSRQRLARMTDRKLVFGQLRTVIYSASIAEGGLLDDLDALIRDPTIGTRVKLALSDGNVRKLLAFKHPAIPRVGRYIDLLLEKESIHLFIPQVNLHTFYRDLKDDGIDPIAPFLNPSEQSVRLDGIGLFRDDRLVGRIPADDMPYFVMLYSHFHQGTLTVQLTENEVVTLSALRSDREVRVRRKAGGVPEAEILVKLHGTVVEHFGYERFSTDKKQDELKRRIVRKVEEKCKEQLELMQRLRADCIGIGQHARRLYGYDEWIKLDWREAFAGMDIKVKAELKVKDFGIYQ
jgi:spore germination protein